MPTSIACLDEVFKLLRKNGPLDVAQICARTLLQTKEVINALKELENMSAVKRRPDKGVPIVTNEVLIVWGLPNLWQ